MGRRYPQEVHDFISANQKGKTAKELAELVNRTFGTEFTESQMKSYRSNHHLKSSRPGGWPAGRSKLFPAEIWSFIEDNYKGVGYKEMADKLNEKFGTCYTPEQIGSFYGNRKLNSGLTGRFKPGHVPANKGKKGWCAPGCEKTQFKKGNLPASTKPIGYERITRDGYVEVKIAMRPSNPFCNDNFIGKHILVWQEANGPVPEGSLIIFRDGNKQNCSLENLALVSKAEHLELTRSGLRSKDPDLTDTGILIAKVKCARQKKVQLKNKTIDKH